MLLGCAFFVSQLAGCDRPPANISGPLLQRGYLWQRTWNPAVLDALRIAETRLDGVVLLGAEILPTSQPPRVIPATIDWDRLRSSQKPLAIAVRVGAFPGPFVAGDLTARTIAETAESLLSAARSHQVELAEFQLDFDCAQKKLAGFRVWLRFLRARIKPLRFVITALPAWLDEPEFKTLLNEVDCYVLQVHSVPTFENGGRMLLCDTDLARKWVTKAAKLGAPFSVALPTYRCLAGYDSTGKLLAVAMDSVEPVWPRGTRVLDFATDADRIASLVHEWMSARPAQLRELLWYRLPVADDERNWGWTTFSAVIAGRAPVHQLVAMQEGNNPIDLSISNAGEASDQGDTTVTATWTGANLLTFDALPGWKVSVEKERAFFTQVAGTRSPLPPSGKRSIGWLRYDKATIVRLQVKELAEIDR
jgi:hypothetical protein